MRFRLITLLIAITFLALGLALYRANEGWTKEQQKLVDLREKFGFGVEPNSFRFDTVGTESVSPMAWKLKVENWDQYQLEMRLHRPNSEPYSHNASLVESDTVIAHQYLSDLKKREFTIGKVLNFRCDATPDSRMAMIKYEGEVSNRPILMLLLGDQKKLEKCHLKFFELSPRSSKLIMSACEEEEVTCITFRLKPIDEDPAKPAW